jgi:hypothetical protein
MGPLSSRGGGAGRDRHIGQLAAATWADIKVSDRAASSSSTSSMMRMAPADSARTAVPTHVVASANEKPGGASAIVGDFLGDGVDSR